MTRIKHLGGAVAVLMAASLFAFTPGISAQTSHSAQQAQQHQAKKKTYAGKIMKLRNGKYALITGKTPQGQITGHFLDDQTDAKKYAGKEVKVTGTLDMASNTIHVTNIAAG